MKFNYQARSSEGETKNGTIEAPTREAALGVLQSQNLLALSLDEETGSIGFQKEIKFLSRVKTEEIVVFSLQLAFLFDAQVPLLSSLHSLAEQTDNPKFRRIIMEIAAKVDAGTPLSDAMGAYPKLFSNFYVSVVRAGEASGRLQEVLSYLADHEEKNYDLNRKVRGALIYPIFVVAAILLVGSIMMIFVVPQITTIFEETGTELPFLTRLVIGISDFLRAAWWGIIIFLFALGYGLKRYLKTESGTRVWDRVLLNIPIFKHLFRKMYLARFSENLSTLIKGGIPILQSLNITASVVGNAVYKQSIEEAASVVERGGSMSEVLRQNTYIPRLVVQMVAVGENSGKLDEILEKVAHFYQRDVDELVNNLAEIIQPVLILLLGVGAGVLVAAILLPIYNLSSGF